MWNIQDWKIPLTILMNVQNNGEWIMYKFSRRKHILKRFKNFWEHFFNRINRLHQPHFITIYLHKKLGVMGKKGVGSLVDVFSFILWMVLKKSLSSVTWGKLSLEINVRNVSLLIIPEIAPYIHTYFLSYSSIKLSGVSNWVGDLKIWLPLL